jgi:hypothetical protein
MYQDAEDGLGSDDPFSQGSFGEQAELKLAIG